MLLYQTYLRYICHYVKKYYFKKIVCKYSKKCVLKGEC